jgi:nucleoside-diphosphate-sugar epimerase
MDTGENKSDGTGVPPAAGVVNPGLIGRVLVLGGGYTGRRFAAALDQLGIPTCRTGRRRPDAAAAAGWMRFDPAEDILPSAADLAGTTHVLSTIPPDASGQDPVLRHLGSVLESLPLCWVGYLSTTGVYGDQGGAWVDETTPVRPGLPRSRQRLACETAWRERGWPLQVFRLPAIYGPGRTPFASLLEGKARLIHKPGQVFSRVHVDDIVGTLLHCLALPAAQRPDTLLVADSCPCPSSETLGYAAHLLGCRLPELIPYNRIHDHLSPMAVSFWNENRRVSNRRLCRSLGYRLRYPSYREGYRACLEEPPRSPSVRSSENLRSGSGSARNGTFRS